MLLRRRICSIALLIALLVLSVVLIYGLLYNYVVECLIRICTYMFLSYICRYRSYR